MRLRSSFTFASDIHARLLRSSSNFQLYTPKLHLEIYIFSGSSVWNSLPSYIHNSNSVQHFKAQYLHWVLVIKDTYNVYHSILDTMCVCIYIKYSHLSGHVYNKKHMYNGVWCFLPFIEVDSHVST